MQLGHPRWRLEVGREDEVCDHCEDGEDGKALRDGGETFRSQPESVEAISVETIRARVFGNC